MKKLTIAGILLIRFSVLPAQDLSGTWGGIINYPVYNVLQDYYFFMEIKQQGKSIWGVYNITDTNNNTIAKCLCSISGILQQKFTSRFDLLRDRVINYDKKPRMLDVCEFMHRLSFHYFNYDSTDYLTGRWAPFDASGVNGGKTGRLIVMQRMSNQFLRNVDGYFTELGKLIDKGESGDRLPIIIPDEISKADIIEKRTIEVLRNMLRNNQKLKIYGPMVSN